MKAFLRFFGIFAILGGIFLFIVGGEVQEANEGQTIQFGYITDGHFSAYDEGVWGRDEEAIEEMGYLKALGVLIGIAGGVMFIASFVVKSEAPQTVTTQPTASTAFSSAAQRVFCAKCGQPGTTDQAFCRYCGTPRKQ